MLINGLQKMTLLDFPGRVACTVFTGGCNFRCPFCHNALLVTEAGKLETISEETFFDFLKKRKGILEGVAITGGEPLLQKDIISFVRKVKELGFPVKLDTNGTFPETLKALAEEKLLDYVAVDIKNSPEKYPVTTGGTKEQLEKVEETVSFLKNGNVPFEFRTTVIREFHSLSDIEKIGEWIKGSRNYFLQNYEDSGNLLGNPDLMHACDTATLEKMKEVAEKYVTHCEIRGV